MKKKYWTNCNSKLIVYYSLIHFSEIKIINNIMLILWKINCLKNNNVFKKFPGKTKDNQNQNFTLNSVETFSFCKTFYHCFFSKKHVATAKNNSNLLLYFHFLVFLFMVILKGFAKNFDRIRSRSDKVVRKRNDSILCFIYYIHSAPKSETTCF